MLRRNSWLTILIVIGAIFGVAFIATAAPVELTFYYPVSVAGPLAQVIDSMVQEFNSTHPDIHVTPVFAGGYNDTLLKAQAAIMGGKPPDVAILLSTDLFTLKAMNAILPLDDFIKGDTDGNSYISDFFPALMANSQLGGHIWSIPFQRSTPILYYNKDIFKEVGLDPNKPPATWDELVAYGKKLLKLNADGTVARWGFEVPFSGGFIWNFEAFIYQTGCPCCNKVKIVSDDGTRVNFTSQHILVALQFFKDLSTVYKIMPNGYINWGTVPSDFLAGRAAMVYHSTGSLSYILKNANFNVGVAFMPGLACYGTPTGGGNLYIFKGISPEHQKAAWTFIRWMTSPEKVADWSIASGYIGVRRSAYNTPAMQKFVSSHPEYLVARDQLQYAHKEFSCYNRSKVTKILFDQLALAVLGKVSPEKALEDAQHQADQVLEHFRH